MDDKSINVLKDLTESFGPAGFERETGRIVREYVSKYVDEIFCDKLGSIVFRKKGDSKRPHVLMAGHIDEVGFVVSGIDDKTGFLSFEPLGGWFDQVLLSQRVRVRTRKGEIIGTIAAKPPHLLSREDMEKVVKKEVMFIDIGSTSKRDSEAMGVRIGDPVVPWSPFQRIKDGKILMGKAFDDRVGAFVAMQVLKKLNEEKVEHPNTIFGVATVQEEVGLRGATTVSSLVDPDIGIVLEVEIDGGIPGVKPREAQARMNKGPAVVTFDATMIPNQLLKELVIETAERKKIPYQLSLISKGGTDAGKIHIHKVGCPTIVIGIPTRHIHSQVGLVSLDDVENTINLTFELVKILDEETVRRLTKI